MLVSQTWKKREESLERYLVWKEQIIEKAEEEEEEAFLMNGSCLYAYVFHST